MPMPILTGSNAGLGRFSQIVRKGDVMNGKMAGMAAAVLVSMATAACVADGEAGREPATKPAAKTVVITGSALYRERIMPPPDATIQFQLNDIARADAPSILIAEQSYALDGKGPPYAFRLTTPGDTLSPRMRYSVQATIRDGAGTMLWTSDTVNLIDPTLPEQALPPINLVKVG